MVITRSILWNRRLPVTATTADSGYTLPDRLKEFMFEYVIQLFLFGDRIDKNVEFEFYKI